MHSSLMPLPVPDVIELLEFPIELDWPAPPSAPEQARTSLELARARQEQLQVLHLDDPRASVFALFS